MSLNCEPTELTPLRRSNCSRRQQQPQQQREEHYNTSEQIEHIDDFDEDRQLYRDGTTSTTTTTVTVNANSNTAASPSALALGHLQSPAFSEYMSINNNNHHLHHHPTTVGSDSSRADTSEPNSQQALNPKAYIMSDTKRIITRVTIDFVVLLAGESLFALFILFHLCITSNKIIDDG